MFSSAIKRAKDTTTTRRAPTRHPPTPAQRGAPSRPHRARGKGPQHGASSVYNMSPGEGTASTSKSTRGSASITSNEQQSQRNRASAASSRASSRTGPSTSQRNAPLQQQHVEQRSLETLPSQIALHCEESNEVYSGSGASPPAHIDDSTAGDLSENTTSSHTTKATTVVDAMYAAIDDNSLCDVTLVGRRHLVKVRAAKFVLASRCPGLQAILYRDPAAHEVYLGEYSFEATRAVIEFCHTGEINRSPFRLDPETNAGVRGWAELTEMAINYQFEDLYEEAYNMLTTIVEANCAFAASVYDEALLFQGKEMEAYGLRVIQFSPPQVLLVGLEPGVQYLSPYSLERLLMNELYVNDMTRILILTRWIERVGREPENVKAAVHCASNIPLDKIDPNFLMTEVMDSGLFDTRVIHEAVGIEPPPPVDSPGSQEILTPDSMSSLEEMLASPAAATKPKKKAKRKKSKKESPLDLQCYQLTAEGVVIMCSTDTPNLLPTFG